MFMAQISCFTEQVLPIAQSVTGNKGESATSFLNDGFVDYALVSLHHLRIYLDTPYQMMINFIEVMTQTTGEIGLRTVDRGNIASSASALRDTRARR